MTPRVPSRVLVPSVEAFAGAAGGCGIVGRAELAQGRLRAAVRREFAAPREGAQAHVVRVAGVPELQRAVLRARGEGRAVRAVGGGRGGYRGDGEAVLDMAGCAGVVYESARGVVVAQAGVRMAALVEWMVERGICVRGCVAGVGSVGGAVARGARGGMWAEGSFVDQVIELSIMDAFGRLRIYSPVHNPRLFSAVMLSMGLFGVIYDVTLRVDSAMRNVAVSNVFRPVRRFFNSERPDDILGLRDMVEAHASVELSWVPFNGYAQAVDAWTPERDDLWLRVLDHTDEAHTLDDPKGRGAMYYSSLTFPQWLNINSAQLVRYGYAEYRPEHCKLFLSLGFKGSKWTQRVRRTVEPLPLAVDYQSDAEAFPAVEAEVALPLRDGHDEDWHGLYDAFRGVLGRVQDADTHSSYPLNVALKVRFVKSSDALLAPIYAAPEARRTSHHAYIQIVSARNTPGWTEFADATLIDWMDIPGARITCSKTLPSTGAAELVRNNLRPNLDAFRAIRRAAAVDDYGMFLKGNPMAELFGMTADCAVEAVTPSTAASDTSPSLPSSIFATAASLPKSTTTGNMDAMSWVTSSASSEATRSPLPPALIQIELGSGASPKFPSVAGREETFSDYDDDSSDFGDAGDASAVEGLLPRDAEFAHRFGLPRPAIRYRDPLSSSELSILCAYVFLYCVLWFALFGRGAAENMGWLGAESEL